MEEAVDKEKIRAEAKRIIDKFAKALESAEKKMKGDEYRVNRKESVRDEKKLEKRNDARFKGRILANAPKKDSNFIIAEKGAFKQ